MNFKEENLKKLIDKTTYVLRETKAQFKNPCVLWSTGKDSTTMLYLIKESFYGTIPFPVIHLDTGWKFLEMYELRDKLAKNLGFNLITARSPNADKFNPTMGVDHTICCQDLKTNVLRKIIERNGYDAVIVSIRRDEHAIRSYERYASPRDNQFRWRLVEEKTEKDDIGDAPFKSLQDTELWSFINSDFGKNTHHVRIHPLLHWTEYDVWLYIQKHSLPINPLYFSKDGYRYRSLGCITCTFPVRSQASNVDEIIEELLETKVEERSGRAQDKEQGMRKKRALGYM